MKLSTLIYRNLKKNIRNYYLYVFALVFSVALYFSFVTLQFDPAMDKTAGSIKGEAAIKAATVLLIVIVAVFLLYANNLFIKRRSKEIGLFQLSGMTRPRIFRLLTAENLAIYAGSLIVGIAAGFAGSRLLKLILFKLTGVDNHATLSFSSAALERTLLVFSAIYVLIMLMNAVFIKRQNLLSLFKGGTVSEETGRKLSWFQILLGILGIGLILTGYYLSTQLFSGDFNDVGSLYIVMVAILGSVILGTYFFYKGSVSFLFNLIRRAKRGYLGVNHVLSLSSIMFRIKSSALLLTVITTVSALALGLLSLSYITYYSTEKTAQGNVPDDFSLTSAETAAQFEQALQEHGIRYSLVKREAVNTQADISGIVGADFEWYNNHSPAHTTLVAVSEDTVKKTDVKPGTAVLAGYRSDTSSLLKLHKGSIVLSGRTFKVTTLREAAVLQYSYTFGMPVAILDAADFAAIAKNPDPRIQKLPWYYGFNLTDKSRDIKETNALFRALGFGSAPGEESQYETTLEQRRNMGLIMFIVGFLGLAFLLTSGCILYFKQMEESENERPIYTILRKLGFTRSDLGGGLAVKQLITFGIPLAVGLCHSYFAVRSGWFFFGSELWTPMVIVMLLYTALYSVFGLLSYFYGRKVIASSL
ncbi:bacitracin ABC transporter permease [Paenibacillus spiritus]|uniref:Bacitracin ABC transporter permease n=1 Tax=Paenibacillus spiritus TaxID=2496557 RepID=A0A5J5G888_9BACL|nr:FtsX-like permease family protein [Paenibacillus spiritus]KAA9004020.1 bacitracin ABC transporter permease [Paenibacillus spiritus]